VLAANLGHGLALVLLAQNAQNLGFAETTLFHEQLKIEKVKSYYFSLLLTGLLIGGAYTVARYGQSGQPPQHPGNGDPAALAGGKRA